MCECIYRKRDNKLPLFHQRWLLQNEQLPFLHHSPEMPLAAKYNKSEITNFGSNIACDNMKGISERVRRENL